MDALAEELLVRLAATSVQTVVLAALVWGVCRWLRRLPAATQCWLWWLVGLQAVLGLVWASPLQLPVLPAAEPAAAIAALAAPEPLAAVTVRPEMAGTAAAGGQPSWPQMLLALWAAGVLLMLARTLLAWRASRHHVRDAAPCRDAQLVGALRMAAEAHGLRRAPPLRVSAQIDSPQLVGPWHPVLLLPARRLPDMADDDLDMALTHELVHLRRRDLWWGLLPALAQHLFFFNPLLHWAVREYAIAREAAVDAAVVAGNRHCRHDYGRLLVRLGVAARPGAGLASASPSFLSLKRRLLMLQNTSSSFPRLGATLVLTAVAMAGVTPMRLVAQPTPPAPPSAPAAPKAPAAATPAKPVTSPAPPAPVAPPAPGAPAVPAAPKAPLATQGHIARAHDPQRDAYVLLHRQGNVMNGSLQDLDEARAAAGKGDALWIRHDGQRYVVRDAATLSRLRALYDDSAALGHSQGELGRQQGALGQRQGELGRSIAELAARSAADALAQARIELKRAGIDAGTARDDVAAAARDTAQQARDGAWQRELEQQIAALAKQQAELGARQAELASRQAAASLRASRETERLLQEVIAKGLAERVGG